MTRRELFCWTAILFTFALGLALNVGIAVFSLLIAATYAACRLGADAVLAFWLAYILTRPLGASLGDLLSQARAYGGRHSPAGTRLRLSRRRHTRLHDRHRRPGGGRAGTGRKPG